MRKSRVIKAQEIENMSEKSFGSDRKVQASDNGPFSLHVSPQMSCARFYVQPQQNVGLMGVFTVCGVDLSPFLLDLFFFIFQFEKNLNITKQSTNKKDTHLRHASLYCTLWT